MKATTTEITISIKIHDGIKAPEKKSYGNTKRLLKKVKEKN